jgi:hypothetical protein
LRDRNWTRTRQQRVEGLGGQDVFISKPGSDS